MDTAALYDTFTHPKVVTSMLLAGVGLGLVLSALLYFFQDAWFLPFAFTAITLGTGIIYLVWLDGQGIRGEEAGSWEGPVQTPVEKRVLIRAESPVVIDTRYGSRLLSDTRIIISMLVLAIGLGLVICIVIIFFRGMWFLPALITALTIGTVAGYLCWIDGLEISRDRDPSRP